MSIPAFDHNDVLPPYLINPALGAGNVSPYNATTLELVQRFGNTPSRKQILVGFLDFRKQLHKEGLTDGFQWLDGSFVEDVEKQLGRNPNDLDLITVYFGYNFAFQQNLAIQVPEFANRNLAKKNYMLDHFPLDATYSAYNTIEFTRYFIQLFTHNRNKVWKGMIRIELNTPVEDGQALNYLQNLKL